MSGTETPELELAPDPATTRWVPVGPQGGVGPQGPPGVGASYGTSLPVSPVDGQEAVLVDSVTNPSYQWRFRYNAGSISPYKWECIGGALVEVTVNPGDNITWASWSAAPNSPTYIVPRSGDYIVGLSAMGYFSGSYSYFGYAGVRKGGTDPNGEDWLYFWNGIVPGGGNPGGFSIYTPASRVRRMNAIVGGSTLVVVSYVNAANFTLAYKTLSVQPVRVA